MPTNHGAVEGEPGGGSGSVIPRLPRHLASVHPAPVRMDDAAFEREALPWLDDVYRFAASMTRNDADAEDIVQETYLRAYRSWHTYRAGSDCRRWLFTICRNVFLRIRARERRQVDHNGTDAALETLAAFRVSESLRSDGLDQLFARLDLGPAISRAVAGLPEVFRTSVVLVDMEQMSYEQAALVLGVPIGTIRSRLFRGRRLLQDTLLTYAHDAGLIPSTAMARGRKAGRAAATDHTPHPDSALPTLLSASLVRTAS